MNFEILEERYLAIDYGEKRVGIAISDPLQIFAIPLVTLNNDSGFWKKFIAIFSSYKIKLVILGYPLKESGKKSRISGLVEKFKEELERKIKVPVVLVDERYSSSVAVERIRESVPSRKKRQSKSMIDMNAAAVILEDYLKEAGSGKL